MLPPELRWQSGRLLTDRSLVRSQVVASFIIDFFAGGFFYCLVYSPCFYSCGFKGFLSIGFC